MNELKKAREIYSTLDNILKIAKDSGLSGDLITKGAVLEYECLIAETNKEIPDFLIPFNKEECFSHGYGNDKYYYASGVKSHIARNIGRVKSIIDDEKVSGILETKDFSFVSNPAIQKILERDYKEIQKNHVTENWKSAILLSGGSIEAILLDLCLKDPTKATSSAKAPSEPDINKWVLNDLIEVSVDVGFVVPEIGKLSHTIRGYRNLIHPAVEIKNKMKVEKEEARIALEVLNILIREL